MSFQVKTSSHIAEYFSIINEVLKNRSFILSEEQREIINEFSDYQTFIDIFKLLNQNSKPLDKPGRCFTQFTRIPHTQKSDTKINSLKVAFCQTVEQVRKRDHFITLVPDIFEKIDSFDRLFDTAHSELRNSKYRMEDELEITTDPIKIEEIKRNYSREQYLLRREIALINFELSEFKQSFRDVCFHQGHLNCCNMCDKIFD